MSQNLSKGSEINLHTVDPGLHRVRVGLGWQAPEASEGFPVDLDSSAFLLGRDGRVRRNTDFVFYNNLETDGGTVRHMGDNIRGGDIAAGTGDRETIDIDLESLHFDVERVAFAVSIHNADERQQTFGLVRDAYIRILNFDTGTELARYNLSENAADNNAFVFGEICRDGISWRFRALGEGGNGGLYKIARDFNVNVAPV